MSDVAALAWPFTYLFLVPALGLGGCSGGGDEGEGDQAPRASAGAPSSGGAAGSPGTNPWAGSGGLGGSAGGSGPPAGSGGGGSTGGGGASSGSGGGSFTCFAEPACNAAPPLPGPERPWQHTSSSITATLGQRHRGRDLFLNPGDPVWAMAKIAYGPNDKDLHDEDVDVYLARDCGATWQKLGTARTTDDGEHETVEGVVDTGGWVFFPVPASLGLGEGRHRFHFVVGGDLSTTESFVEIVKPGTPVIISDVDGTLTTSEFEEFGDLLTGDLPDANEGGAALVSTWAARGYRRFYLTARPEWLGARTREFLRRREFPEGIVHTTLSFTGALESAATAFKTGELAQLASKGLVPTFALGNTKTDAEAYSNAGIAPLSHRIFLQFTDSIFGGRRVESYTELLGEAAALPDRCPE
ncbi:MAG: phosphatidylinositol transfer protein [Polyangiaceae bacterium]|nr:phosphatidylinositol transfer protein [Polyangiaceae bacterium]